MPVRPNPLLAQSAEPDEMPRVRPNPLMSGGGARRPNPLLSQEAMTPAEEPEEFPWGKAALALGGVGLAAALTRGTSLRNVGEVVNSARQQSMLSGFAPIKSALGNVGAAIEQSALRRDLGPIKALLSPETVQDAISSYKANSLPPGVRAIPGMPHTPGRFMQALDDATQGALRRGGLGAEEAQTAVLQAPLPQKLQEALDSPVGRYAIPFRRTPFNQFIEGFGRFGKGYDPVVTPAYIGAGALHGYATADDDVPASLPFAIAGSASHGVPYAAGALLGRLYGHGKPSSQIAASMLPTSEYGITQSVYDPQGPLTWKGSGIYKALTKLSGR